MPGIDDQFDLVIQQEDPTIAALPRDDLDLAVENGDLMVRSGVENLKASLIRRLSTPLGQYGILVGGYDEEGNRTILRVGSTYGSDLGAYLSEPLTNDWIRSILTVITDTLGKDTRISIADIEVSILEPAQGRVRFEVKYDVVSEGTPQTLSLETGAGGISIAP